MRGAVLVSSLFVLAGCTQGASSDPALDAKMRVANAQFVAGPTPVAADGPDVEAINLLTNTIWLGYADKPLAGALGATATAAALALDGDSGYWIVAAGVPDVAAPSFPTFHASAAFSTTLTPGTYALEVRAVNASNRFGVPSRQTLTAVPGSPSVSVTGALVVTLTWDTEADLDLHVVDPLGNEIFHGAPRSASPSEPDTSDGGDGTAGVGVLDVDSNAECVIDGLRREDVVWASDPPSGDYLVRVDAASLCGQASAHWKVEVTHDGTSLGGAIGLALDSDTRGAHDRGAGILADEFELP
jgi:hypothetical protein